MSKKTEAKVKVYGHKYKLGWYNNKTDAGLEETFFNLTWVPLIVANPKDFGFKRCLRCDEQFKSEGKHNRVCNYCKIQNDSNVSGTFPPLKLRHY